MASIAIIGTGISGISAAYLLHKQHIITVYEKAAEIGGHTRTRIVRYGKMDIPVDTGFIVFNYKNYPNLTALFKHLDIAVKKSNMSFGVTDTQNNLEWSAQNLNGVFGQRGNLARPDFYHFLLAVLRFNRTAVREAARHPRMKLGELIEHMQLGEWFARYYILPMGGAIWSCSLPAILSFPAKTFVDFFEAHGLLSVTGQPQWYTVTGGSHEYIKRLTAPFIDRIRTDCAALSVTRSGGKVQIRDARSETLAYDHVICASHADQTLAILSDATAEERSTLAPFKYQKNTAILHRDASLMPSRKRCWASWIYHAADAEQASISVTYWMNQLQSIDDKYPLFLTLNPQRPLIPELIFDTHEFEHPIYSADAIAAQSRLPLLQGKQHTWFCGAYHCNGFHEDGLTSAVSVARQLGAEVPWH